MEKLMFRVFIWSVMILTSLLSACDHEKPKPVARSFDQFLYPDDLKGVVPAGVTGDDSTQLVHAYIEQWLRQQALLYHAQRNVNMNTERLNKQVETYKKGLIVYEYEQALVSQKLDTVVTDDEISQYYDDRPELFILQQPIFKRSYIRLRTDAPELERVKRLLVSPDFEAQDLLTKYCTMYATDYALLDTSWHYAEDVVKEIPLARIDEADYGQTARIFEIIENNELYLIILHDSKLRDERSPLPLAQGQIRNLILNKRKIDLIDRMQRSIVADAREKNNIEIYN
ncbi:peptidylprolyl isomerase [Parapedobacter sp. 10938]|uniref:peptidylprolyl isomerase n=1 Tax=Parapedobacter flavus TaxID=3110225 RepID=UPI002DBCDC1E|nr:peptidylprolyl isomerase [Parapedobacter sp. 10938]MEC3881149.1 peptidylprolyl isomerase [Parapedobacter sp. 10938]